MRKLFAVFVLALACTCSVQGDVGNLNPDAVLGKPDFTTPETSVTEKSLEATPGIAFDADSGRIYVCDMPNNRVLWWNNYQSLTSGKPADGVLGQPNLYTSTSNIAGVTPATLNQPCAVCVDGTSVWVADRGNNRVLRYSKPVTIGMRASVVLGQPDFTTGSVVPATESSLNFPSAIMKDYSGNLWVADTNNNRVLEFPLATLNTSGSPAIRVFGQTDFVSNVSSCTATQLAHPYGLVVDSSNNIWVADKDNHRVVRFQPPFEVTGHAMDLVIGAADKTGSYYTSASAADNKSFNAPEGITIDNTGRLFVSDPGWHRVLGFSNVIADGATADTVLGQPDCSGSLANNGTGDNSTWNVSARSLYMPSAVTFDPDNRLYVGDAGNGRVLRYQGPFVNFMAADLELGKESFTSGEAPRDAREMDMPMKTACAGNGRVYVADSDNHRVLWWDSAASLAGNAPANGVIGQDGFITHDASAGTRGLSNPYGVAVDAAGNLYVADSGNSRVLIYLDHVHRNSQEADRVLGQVNFTNVASNDTNGDGNGDGNPSAATLDTPKALAVDGNGILWVADWHNNRVLRFTPPFTNGKSADLVLGQPDFFTTGRIPRAPAVHGAPSASGEEETYAVTAHSLSMPEGIACDGAGNVWVADTDNGRVVKYALPFTNGMDACIVLGKQNFTGERVIYDSPARGAPAQVRMAMPAADTLASPRGIAIDQTGDVWVADTGCNRVLRYAVPISSGMKACYVLGQQSFSGYAGNDSNNDGTTDQVSALTYDQPCGVSFDSAGNLWVADSSNCRVLCYNRHYVAPVVDGSSTTATMKMGNFEVNVKVPQDAFAGNANISVAPVIVPPSISSQLTVTPISFEISDTLGSQQPRRAITITISYRAEDYTDTQAQLLKLALYNPATQTWTLVPTTVDTTQHLLTATISHFSTYAVVMTNSSAPQPQTTFHAYPYPNPFRAGIETMKIEGQPDGTKINVFTVAGEHVRSLPSPDGNGTVTWDGRNDGGKTVASGVYLLSIDGPAGKKRVKVAVQK